MTLYSTQDEFGFLVSNATVQLLVKLVSRHKNLALFKYIYINTIPLPLHFPLWKYSHTPLWKCFQWPNIDYFHPLQSYSMDCYFRQSWVDRRLAFSGQKNLALSIEMLRKIWKPDTYIYNGRKSYLHTITTPNKFMRLFPNGRVLYSQRWEMNY